MKKINALLFIFMLSLLACKKSPPPLEWIEHKKTVQDSYLQELSAPSAIQSLYFEDKNEIYLIGTPDSLKLSDNKNSGDVQMSLTVNFEDTTLKFGEESFKENTPISLNERFKLKFFNYSEREVKKIRVFLYDLKKTDLAQLRKRDFFDYSKKFVFNATYKPLLKKYKVTFSRSDGSETDLLKLGDLEIKNKGSLSIYGEENSNETQAMIMFKDETNGVSTYGAGRYAVVDFKKPLSSLKEGDTAIVDFNYATNPPCAKSKAYHCPLAQDSFTFKIEAGEKYSK